MTHSPLRVVLIKPSKYAEDGWVERFRWGFMPNSTLAHLATLTLCGPQPHGQRPEVIAVDEYVHTDLAYLEALRRDPGRPTLLALVGVQSHQLHRALDLAALARSRGVEHCILGGPHPMTCDTTELQGRGVSFALAEAETVWPRILADAAAGELAPLYGREGRWHDELDPPPLVPPSRRDLRRYLVRLLGIYPARGCPYTCNFCSVIKIAGRHVRAQPVATTLASLAAARTAGVRWVIFTSDNFNKYPEVRELLRGMIAEDLRLPFFAQCDVQIERDEELVELMARAGCFQIFVGAESFSREALRGAHKFQNHPERYARIVELCRRHGITSHLSNILGFPSDTEASIREHLATLRALTPDIASFYILTPIPGTEQYGEFLTTGLITEPNLDRYDGTCVTWRHPHLEPARWREHLFHCYREFYTAGHCARTIGRWLRPPLDSRRRAALAAVAGYPAQSWLAVRAQAHPMSGGVGRERGDHLREYLPLRRHRFGFDLARLPENLSLTAADEAMNRRAKLPVIAEPPARLAASS